MNLENAPATKGDLKAFQDELMIALKGVRGDITGMRGEIAGVQGDITGIRGDITGIQGDITGIQGDITGIQGDITGIQGDITGMRGEIAGVRDELKTTHRSLAIEIVKTHGRIDQLREDLRGEMSIQVSGIFKKIDGFMSKVGKVDRAQVIADWRMTQIEKRVDKAESRPA